MQKEELAALITGREVGAELTKDERELAKTYGLLVLFGASDDLMEMRGAIEDEVGAYEGVEIRLSKDLKILHGQDEEEHEEFLKEHGLRDALMARYYTKITAIWCPHEAQRDTTEEIPADAPECSWLITTNAPHATFDIMENGQLYCRGLVISTSDLK